ncbi:MAG: hypothetical protein JWR57_964 [Mycetocola sp.]|nr:hypothetical protein [Mycetocola sp.]
MSADSASPGLLSPQIKAPRRPISRAKLEVVMSRSVAVFGLAFGAQAVPVALSQRHLVSDAWFNTMGIAFFASLVILFVATLAKRFVRGTNAVVALLFLFSLVTWPYGVTADVWPIDDRTWLWFLVTVATSVAAMAFSTWIATGYTLLAPAMYGVVRVSPFGGSANMGIVVLDVLYAVILGGAVLIMVTLLRSAASEVDTAQSMALNRYGNAVREHATEIERVRVDAIVHDSVLTTLLSAARAYTPEAKTLATTMAAHAIVHLQAQSVLSPDDEEPVTTSSVGDRICWVAPTLSESIEVRRGDLGDGTVPAQAGEAVCSAALQAMVNSMQHAGDAPDVARWVSVEARTGGLVVEVGDTGRGFCRSDVPVERLGLRVSIIERVTNGGGAVRVHSVVGEGTVIRIAWPASVLEVSP